MESISKSKKLKRQVCEIYSRVVGYIRPVDSWNIGKQSEYSDRKEFNKYKNIRINK